MEPQTQQVEALNNEIRILKKLRHQRIVSYYGSGQRDGQLHLFMEFMAGGSLCDQIKRNGVLPEHLSKRYTKQMLEGVNFLHSRDIIHRDIKGANVLLDIEGLNVKLADFGLSKMIENVGSKTNLATCCGTSYWLAPEILWGQGYGRKADIWSLGCTVVEMLTGKPPLGHLEPPAAMFRIGFKPLNLTLPESVSNEAKRFIEAALTWKPEKRPWSHELQSYTFISKRNEMEEISLDLKAASHPVKHGTPTNDELEELGCSIARTWKTLGRRLSITEERLNEIGHATGNELSVKGYQVLRQWKEQYGPAVTYKVLCDALEHKPVKRKDLAVKFCYINVKHGTPTDDELEGLGCSIARKWKRLGRRLSVTEERLNEIEHATGNELSEKGYQVLKQWKHQYGPFATYKVLCDALEHNLVKRKDLAVKFCYIDGQHMGATASSSIQKTCPDEDAGAEALPQTQETGLGQHMSATCSSLMQETLPDGDDDTPFPIPVTTAGDDTPLPIPETSAGALRHFSQLPQTIPHFVSRVQECSDISRYLCPEHNCRCVLLHGVTGVGKTSTAIKVANDRLNSDGRTVVVYVNCRYIDSLDDFANKVLQQVYHYPVEDPISELKNRLKSQDDYTVLLLDNFEFLLHLGDIGPDTPHEGAMAQEKTTLPTEGTKIKNFITEIVEISRKVKLLVTSSERIVFPSLGQEDVHLACFTPEESCQLLQKICKERVENQLQCAYQLSEICSGIPLVLYTLALSHSDLLSLVERMSCSPPQGTFEFLIKIQLVPEEEKINKCLDICFGRLSAQEKNTLLTLALLRGRFTLPRAEQIFQSLMPRENQLTVNALELAKRSLLEHIIVAGVCVYTFLRVIRDYCRKMESDQSGFREVFVNARNVFIDHFFAFLTDTFRLFLSKHASDAITAFRQEEENIMQLVEWCDNGKMTVVQIRKCIDVFNSAGELLAKMIGKEKYESVFTSLRKKSEEMGDQKRLSECLTSLGIKQVFHCSCAPGLCYVAAERAKEYLVEADRIQSSPDLSVNTGNSRAQCLSKLGRCLAKEGKFREGREKIQQAIDIRRRHGEEDIVMLAATYNDMAVALSLEGDHQEAIDIRERRTLPIYRERLGDHPFTATILNNLSNNFFTLGQYDNAKQYSDEALRMRLELLKDHRDTAKSLFDLGMVHKESGELQQAKEYLERCKTMQEKVLDDNIKDLQRTRNEIEEVCNRLARQQLE